MLYYLMINELFVCCVAVCLVLFRINGIVFSKRYVLYPLAFLLIIMLVYLSGFSYFAIASSYVLMYFVLPVALAKGVKRTSVLFTSFTVVGIQSAVKIIFRIPVNFINAGENLSIILNIAVEYLVLAALAAVIFSNKGYSYIMDLKMVSGNVKTALVAYIWIFWVLVVALQDLIVDEPMLSYRFTIFIFIIILYVASFVIIYLLIKNNIDSGYYKRLSEAMEENVREQVSHYNQLTKANEDLRRFRHDYQNLRLGLGVYLEKNDIQGAVKFLNDCGNITERDYIMYNTGHPIVNAIISDKASKAKDANISITFEGLVPCDALNSVDLCIVFGNLIDNAIDACRKFTDSAEKVISVKAEKRHDYLFVSVTNPTTVNVKIKKNKIPTTKRDKGFHGIGLYSVRSVTSKYSGHLTLSCVDRVFTAGADFSLCPDLCQSGEQRCNSVSRGA